MTLRRALLAAGAVALTAACGGRTDHERLGDRRYAEQAWLDALAEYRLAARQRRPSPELRAKTAAAAQHAGALLDAVREYRELWRSEAASRAEAVEGLVQVLARASAARDLVAMRAAVGALRELAPSRAATILDPEIVAALQGDGQPADPDLLLAAAARSGPGRTDSLLVRWAEALARTGRCDVAVRAWEAVVRRGGAGPVLEREARAGTAGCRVEAGRALLAAGDLAGAAIAFETAVGVGMPDSTVRLAWVLLGDVRWADGDTAAAGAAYDRAIAGGVEESAVVRRAREQLARLRAGNPKQP